jgi:hypothetical protein
MRTPTAKQRTNLFHSVSVVDVNVNVQHTLVAPEEQL